MCIFSSRDGENASFRYTNCTVTQDDELSKKQPRHGRSKVPPENESLLHCTAGTPLGHGRAACAGSRPLWRSARSGRPVHHHTQNNIHRNSPHQGRLLQSADGRHERVTLTFGCFKIGASPTGLKRMMTAAGTATTSARHSHAAVQVTHGSANPQAQPAHLCRAQAAQAVTCRASDMLSCWANAGQSGGHTRVTARRSCDSGRERGH
jgi:hypothetical protein